MTSQDVSETPAFSKTVDGYTVVGKNLLALLRDVVLVVLFLMLLIVPQFVGDRLAKAGFKKGSVMGFEWESKAVEFGSRATQLDTQLKDAKFVIARQSEQLEANQKALAELVKTGVVTAQAIQPLNDQNKRVVDNATKAKAAISTTIANAAPTVAEAEKILSNDIQWAVIFSGNSNLDGGKYERDKQAPKFNVKKSDVYYRQGSYRVATLIDGRSDAPRIISALRPRYPDAYVVNFNGWCPNPKLVEGQGYYTC